MSIESGPSLRSAAGTKGLRQNSASARQGLFHHNQRRCFRLESKKADRKIPEPCIGPLGPCKPRTRNYYRSSPANEKAKLFVRALLDGFLPPPPRVSQMIPSDGFMIDPEGRRWTKHLHYNFDCPPDHRTSRQLTGARTRRGHSAGGEERHKKSQSRHKKNINQRKRTLNFGVRSAVAHRLVAFP